MTTAVVMDVTSVVELKMSNSSCCLMKYQTCSNDQKWTCERIPDLAEGFGPFAQALVYNIVHVLPGHVRNNVQPEQLPVTIVAGKLKSGNGIRQTASFVQGHLHVPERFGENFYYSISRCGSFDNHQGSIVAYLNTLCYGARTAVRAIQSQQNVPTAMLCSSKRCIGQQDISDCRLMASPVFDTSRFPMTTTQEG